MRSGEVMNESVGLANPERFFDGKGAAGSVCLSGLLSVKAGAVDSVGRGVSMDGAVASEGVRTGKVGDTVVAAVVPDAVGRASSAMGDRIGS